MDTTSWLTPAFILALATLITAVTGLVAALRAHSVATAASNKADAAHVTISDMNGTVPILMARIESLESAFKAVIALHTHPGSSAPDLTPQNAQKGP